MSEEELIARAQKGDREAFNKLMMRYEGPLYNVAYRILGDEQDAADATQDAFLSSYQAIRRFRGGSFRSWLMRIVINASYNCMRRANRGRIASLDEDEERIWHEDLTGPGELPDVWTERRDLSQRLQRALATLSPMHRIVVVLVDLQGLSYAEVARILRLPLGTVRSRLSRARHGLRDQLLWPLSSEPSHTQAGGGPTSPHGPYDQLQDASRLAF